MRPWMLLLLSIAAGWCFSNAFIRGRVDEPSDFKRQRGGTLDLKRNKTGLGAGRGSEPVEHSQSLSELGTTSHQIIAELQGTKARDLRSYFESLERLPSTFRSTMERLAIVRWIDLDEDDARAYFTPEHPRYDLFLTELGRLVEMTDLSDENHSAMGSLLLGMAQSDPRRCSRLLRQYQNAVVHPQRLKPIYQELARQAPNLAIESAEEIRSLRELEEVMQVITESWAEVDPESASKWAEAQVLVRSHPAVEAWAKKNPVSAAVYLSSLQDSGKRSRLAPSVFKHWAGEDPDAAIAWLEAEVGSAHHKSCFYQAIAEVGAIDLESAWGLLRRSPHDPESPMRLSSLGRFWGANDPEAVTGWFDDPELARQLVETHFFEGFVEEWYAYAPRSAAAFKTRISELVKLKHDSL